MKYDDILATIGEFGLYQKIIFILASLCTLFAPMNVVIQVFSADKTDHWCDVQDLWENCTSCLGADVDCQEAMKNISLPVGVDGMVDQCNRYDIQMAGDCSDLVLPQVQDEGMNYSDYIVPCDSGWIYDTSQYKSTIISDFDLVCNKQSLPNFAQTAFFAGTMAGSVFFGCLSDRLGRRVGLFSSTASTGVFGILVVVSNSFTMYAIMRFFLGASTYSTFITAFVLVSEIVAPSKRVFTGIIIEFFFAFGIMALAILAFFIRTWRILQLATSLPGIATLALIPFIPESPRWLISKGRKDEALVIIRRTARINGVNLTHQALQQMTKVDSEYPSQTTDESSLIPLFRSPTMRFQTLKLLFIWFVQSLVYYGLTLSTGSLGVNIYAGFFLSGAVEIIGYGSVMFMIEAIGRKFSLAGYLLLVGISCILVMLTPGITKFVIGMIGKAAISGTFGIIYVYTAELYPTPLRAITVGMCSMASKVGGMICPLVFILAFRWPHLPLPLFAAASICAAAITFFLPETRRLPLPETLQEAEALSYRGRRHVPIPTKGLEEDNDLQ